MIEFYKYRPRRELKSYFFSIDTIHKQDDSQTTKHFFLHFSASILLAPYMHNFFAVVQMMYFFGAVWIEFGANLASNLKKLVSNIRTKE